MLLQPLIRISALAALMLHTLPAGSWSAVAQVAAADSVEVYIAAIEFMHAEHGGRPVTDRPVWVMARPPRSSSDTPVFTAASATWQLFEDHLPTARLAWPRDSLDWCPDRRARRRGPGGCPIHDDGVIILLESLAFHGADTAEVAVGLTDGWPRSGSASIWGRLLLVQENGGWVVRRILRMRVS